jgi:hypothetical protein
LEGKGDTDDDPPEDGCGGAATLIEPCGDGYKPCPDQAEPSCPDEFVGPPCDPDKYSRNVGVSALASTSLDDHLARVLLRDQKSIGSSASED